MFSCDLNTPLLAGQYDIKTIDKDGKEKFIQYFLIKQKTIQECDTYAVKMIFE